MPETLAVAEEFLTYDFWLAIILLTKRVELTDIVWEGRRACFHFKHRRQCEELEQAFRDGALKVDAKTFSDCERSIKDRFYGITNYVNNVYLRTSDFWLASTLVATGIPMDSMQWEKGRAIFVFPKGHEYKEILSKYWSHSLVVNAQTLVEAEKDIKNRLKDSTVSSSTEPSYSA